MTISSNPSCLLAKVRSSTLFLLTDNDPIDISCTLGMIIVVYELG